MNYRSASALSVAIVACLLPEMINAAADPEPPQAQFHDFFIAVQTAHIFADSKSFADAIPKAAPADILNDYHARRPRSPAQLKDFVDAHFTLPVAAATASALPENLSIGSHIDALWNQLTRTTTTAPIYSSQLPLPKPYVVPGGRFREMYYWDSYFTMLGLVESGRADLVEDMVRNFAYLIDTYGHIPNGARSYYLSRSQPPFFFKMVELLSPEDPAKAFAQFLPQLKKEYAFWMEGAEGLRAGTAHRRVVALADGSILNRYWDDRPAPRDESYREDSELARAVKRDVRQMFRDIRAAAESGWDFSSRWFADAHALSTIETTQIVPVDLNSLLFGLENAIHNACAQSADRACAAEFSHRAARRRAAIDRYLWDAPAGAYLDYRWTHRQRIRRVSAATLYPLFVGVATERQAIAVARTTGALLLKPGGIVTTTLVTGQQWDAPNGWAPLQWIAVSGLARNSEPKLAEAIACRWMFNVNHVYGRTGKLVEKYDVVTLNRSSGGGEYPVQDGFGWTNGVMKKLMALYSADAAYGSLAQCPQPQVVRARH